MQQDFQELITAFGERVTYDEGIQTLMQQGDFQSALTRIESRLVEDPADIAARLAWVRCQLALGAMPVSALSAPLDEISTTLQNGDAGAVWPFACQTLLEFSGKLFEKGQTKLAILMLERVGDGAAKDNTIPLTLRERLAKVVIATARNVLEQLRQRGTEREYLPTLEALISKEELRLSQITKQLATDKPAPVASMVINANGSGGEPGNGKRRKPITARSISQEALYRENNGDGWTIGGAPSQPAGTELSGAQKAAADPFARFKRFEASYVLLIAFALILVLGWQIYVRTAGSVADLSERLATPVTAIAPTELTPPALPLRADDTGIANTNTNLDQISEKLKRIDLAQSSPPMPASATGSSLPEAPDTRTVDNSMEEVESGSGESSRFGDKSSEQEKLPELDPDKTSVETVDLGRAGKRTSTAVEANRNERVRTGPDGRVYGPGPDSESSSVDPKTGEPIRSYPVKQFRPPLLYRTIVQTKVLSAPSMTGVTRDVLPPNITVHVYAKMDRWLELRPKGGKPGYIYAQDARLIRE